MGYFSASASLPTDLAVHFSAIQKEVEEMDVQGISSTFKAKLGDLRHRLAALERELCTWRNAAEPPKPREPHENIRLLAQVLGPDWKIEPDEGGRPDVWRLVSQLGMWMRIQEVSAPLDSSTRKAYADALLDAVCAGLKGEVVMTITASTTGLHVDVSN
jgi:hypothetical protein